MNNVGRVAKLTSPFYVVTRIGNYPCDADQAKNVIKLTTAGKKGMIELNGSYFAIDSVQGVLKNEDYERHINIKAFRWECLWGFWHDQNGQCAHTKQDMERHANKKIENTTNRLPSSDKAIETTGEVHS